MGRACKTYRPRPICSAQGTKNPLPLGMGSVNCTAGEGWYQEEGKDAVSLCEGSVILIPTNVKHWHGAKKNSWFSHIAVEVSGEDCTNEWCEPVSDAEYDVLENAI